VRVVVCARVCDNSEEISSKRTVNRSMWPWQWFTERGSVQHSVNINFQFKLFHTLRVCCVKVIKSSHSSVECWNTSRESKIDFLSTFPKLHNRLLGLSRLYVYPLSRTWRVLWYFILDSLIWNPSKNFAVKVGKKYYAI